MGDCFWKKNKFGLSGEMVNRIYFSPNGKIIAGGTKDGVILWDASSGLKLRTLNQPSVGNLAFSPDGTTLAVTSRDYSEKYVVKYCVILWNVTSGKELQILRSYGSEITSITFSHDSKTLVLGSYNYVDIWDTTSWQKLRTWEESGIVLNTVFSPDDKSLLSTTGNAVTIWDKESGNKIRSLDGYTYAVRDIDFLPNGKTLASATNNRTTLLWDSNAGYLLRTIKVGHEVYSIAISPDGKILAAAGGNYVTLWNATTGQKQRILADEYSRFFSKLAFSPDGKMLSASGSTWDVASGQVLFNFGAEKFSPDGKTLAFASGGNEGIVTLLNPVTGQKLHTLEIGFKVDSIAYSPDSKIMATASTYGYDDERKTIVTLIDVTSGLSLGTPIKKEKQSLHSLTFSPDGKTLAAGSNNKIILWDANSWQELRTLEGHSDIVSSVKFSPDGRTLASGSADGTIILWNVP